MYAEFYGLTARAFQLTPDARFFFESTVHRQAMAYLVYGLHHAEGFIIITGEVGAGKTILVDNLLSTIDQSNFIVAKIVTTQLAGDDLLHLVAGGFGIAKEGLAKGSLLQRINDFVLAQQRNGRRVLLIVDEAQNLSFEALEELRMLSNIVVDRTMALQSFLLGQPQFRVSRGLPRITRNCGWPSKKLCSAMVLSTTMLESIRSSSSASKDRFCASSTISSTRLPLRCCANTKSLMRCSSDPLASPSLAMPNAPATRYRRSSPAN